MVQTLWKTIWRFLKKTEILYMIQDPAVPLLGIYSEKTIIQKCTSTTMVTIALFTIAKTWKQPRCPLIEKRIKMWRNIQWAITQP